MARGVSKDLSVRAKLDARKFSTGAQNMRRDMRQISKDTNMMARSIQGAFAGVALASVVQFTKAIKDLAQEADTLNRKTAVVFGQFDKQVTETAERIATSMGMTVDEFRAATVGTADLLVPLGFTREVSAGLATDLTKLSSALAEWNTKGLNATQVSEILTKTLLGEAEQIKQLGIVIRQDSSFQKLVKETAEATGQTEKQAKATLILQQIMEQSQDAQAAYARNNDSIARNSNEAAAEIRQFKEDIINGLVPAIQESTIGLADFVVGVRVLKDELSGNGGSNLSKSIEWVTEGYKTWLSVVTLGTPQMIAWIQSLGKEQRDYNKALRETKDLITDGSMPFAPEDGPQPFVFGVDQADGSKGVSTTSKPTSGGVTRQSAIEPLLTPSPFGLSVDSDILPDMSNQLKGVTASLKEATDAGIDFGGSLRDSLDSAAAGIAVFHAAQREGIMGSIKLLANEATAALIAKIMAAVPFPANIAIAAGAGAMIGKLFSGIGGGNTSTGGGVTGGRGFATRRDYGPGASDFTGLGNLSFTLEGTTLVAAINRTNGRLGRVQGNG